MNNFKILNDEQLESVQGGIKIADPKDGTAGFIGDKKGSKFTATDDLSKFTATDDLAKSQNGFYEAWPAGK